MNYRLTELKVLLFLLLLSAVSCQRPMYDEEDDEDGVSQTNLPLEEFYKLKYCSTVVYMVPRA